MIFMLTVKMRLIKLQEMRELLYRSEAWPCVHLWKVQVLMKVINQVSLIFTSVYLALMPETPKDIL